MNRGMLLTGALIVTASVSAMSSSLMAQSDPIAERQQLMKRNSQELRPLIAAQKGSAPFDLTQTQAALKSIVADYRKAATLFPDNSQTGGDTRALPKIWTDKANFDAGFTKAIATVEAAQAAIKDEASFKAEFPKVLNSCDSCHETYRAPRR